jgi:hypothetical protein
MPQFIYRCTYCHENVTRGRKHKNCDEPAQCPTCKREMVGPVLPREPMPRLPPLSRLPPDPSLTPRELRVPNVKMTNCEFRHMRVAGISASNVNIAADGLLIWDCPKGIILRDAHLDGKNIDIR